MVFKILVLYYGYVLLLVKRDRSWVELSSFVCAGRAFKTIRALFCVRLFSVTARMPKRGKKEDVKSEAVQDEGRYNDGHVKLVRDLFSSPFLIYPCMPFRT